MKYLVILKSNAAMIFSFKDLQEALTDMNGWVNHFTSEVEAM